VTTQIVPADREPGSLSTRVDNKTAAALSTEIRRLVIECSYEAGVGHIGCSLSVADILSALFGSVLRDRRDTERDRFVLSKGHAGLGLYAALVLTGRLDRDALTGFCRAGGLFGVHPDPGLPGVDFGTGSLGHGLSIGAGVALATRLRGGRSRAFVLLSDAELNEGAVWEAAQFASHHQLGNLVAIVDVDGQQAFGYTEEVVRILDLSGVWGAFGWEVKSVDGHDTTALCRALDGESARPRIILAETTFGRGVSFMERQIAWHYLPLDAAQYRRAMQELKES
jgi:transketolase